MPMADTPLIIAYNYRITLYSSSLFRTGFLSKDKRSESVKQELHSNIGQRKNTIKYNKNNLNNRQKQIKVAQGCANMWYLKMKDMVVKMYIERQKEIYFRHFRALVMNCPVDLSEDLNEGINLEDKWLCFHPNKLMFVGEELNQIWKQWLDI